MVDLKPFRQRYGMFLFYQPIQNRWKFNICFNVWVVFRLLFAVRACKQRPPCFWPVFKQDRSRPHSPGWARVPRSWFFPQISINFSYFSSNFTYYLPHLGRPGGRVAHPGRPWLRHCFQASKRDSDLFTVYGTTFSIKTVFEFLTFSY